MPSPNCRGEESIPHRVRSTRGEPLEFQLAHGCHARSSTTTPVPWGAHILQIIPFTLDLSSGGSSSGWALVLPLKVCIVQGWPFLPPQSTWCLIGLLSASSPHPQRGSLMRIGCWQVSPRSLSVSKTEPLGSWQLPHPGRWLIHWLTITMPPIT